MDETKVGDPQQDAKAATGSKFETFFDEPYNQIKEVMGRQIKDGDRIIDLGSNIGNLEDHLDSLSRQYQVECVDSDQASLDILSGKQYDNLQINSHCQDANEYMAQYNGEPVDVILLNATLHEINTPADQAAYLDDFLGKAGKALKAGGKIIVGDYYYPPDVTDAQVDAYKAYQLATINHADSRDKFVAPKLLKQRAEANGYTVEDPLDIQAVKQINRRYYTMVMTKL